MSAYCINHPKIASIQKSTSVTKASFENKYIQMIRVIIKKKERKKIHRLTCYTALRLNAESLKNQNLSNIKRFKAVIHPITFVIYM